MEDIRINDLSFAYEGGEKLVLKDINARIEAGEFYLYPGPVRLWKEYAFTPFSRT